MKKYRGLTKKGNWVYGWLLKLLDGSFIIVSEAAKTTETHHHYPSVSLGIYSEVIPKTVGQQTGLLDLDGTDLDWWEGDVFDHLGHKGLIEWYEGGLFYHDHGGYCPIGDVLVWAVFPNKIGDIHTKPELLEKT